jgi:leucine-zipper-like transcriptional regulator 1
LKRYLLLTVPLLALALAGCSSSPTSPGKTGGWVEATSQAFSDGGRYGLTGTVFNNEMWAIGGAAEGSGGATVYFSDVWNSSSGSAWTEATGSAPFGGRYGSQVLSYNGSLWLIGGDNNGSLMNDVWSSPDGKNWTKVLADSNAPGPNQFSPRCLFGAVVYNNAMWVIGGWDGKDRNDVWTSTDGVNWDEVTAAAQFQGRWGFACTVYNNEIWVMAGANSTNFTSDPSQAYGDAWFSANGNAWTQATSYGGYGLMYFIPATANNNLLYLTGGYLWNDWGSQALDATSPNGTQWTRNNDDYPERFGHVSLTYNNSVWLIGGVDDVCWNVGTCPVTYLNDVWHNP